MEGEWRDGMLVETRIQQITKPWEPYALPISNARHGSLTDLPNERYKKRNIYIISDRKASLLAIGAVEIKSIMVLDYLSLIKNGSPSHQNHINTGPEMPSKGQRICQHWNNGKRCKG